MANSSISRYRVLVALLAALVPTVSAGGVSEAERRAQIDLICQPIVEDGRARVQRMVWLAEEDFRTRTAKCKGEPSCIQRARARAAQRDRQIQNEQAAIARRAKQCEARLSPAPPPPIAQPPAESEPTTRDGDWIPPDQCQARAAANRDRFRWERKRAAEAYGNERMQCAGNWACLNRAKQRAAERAREIEILEARAAADARTCQLGDSPEGNEDFPRTPSGDWDPDAPQPGGQRRNQYGDWLPDEPCDGFIEFSRRRIRKLQIEASEAYRVDRIACAGQFTCLQRAKETAAQRQIAIKTEEARLNEELRRCQIRLAPR